jgi:6-phosphogluconolactonase (cycloisomerase 2 family)
MLREFPRVQPIFRQAKEEISSVPQAQQQARRGRIMRVRSRVISLLALAAFAIATTACGSKFDCGGTSGGSGGGGGSTSSKTVCGGGTGTGGSGGGTTGALDYLYSINGTSVDGAFFDGTAIQAINGFVPVNLGTGAATDSTVVNGQFLYVPWVPQGQTATVQVFSIAHSSGALTAVTGSPFALNTTASDSIAADPKGRFLFVGDSVTGVISALSINSTTGALTVAPGSPFAVSGANPTHLAVDGTGTYLYATVSARNGVVFGFSIDQTTGALTPIPGSPFILFVTELAAVPNGKFLIGSGGADIEVIAFAQGSGALSSQSTLTPTNAPFQAIVSPNGNFVYTFSSPVAAPEAFSLDGSGNLTELTGSPFTTLAPINRAKIDQNGTAIFGLNQSSQFFVYVVDPTTGLLTAPAPVYGGTGSPFFAVTN